MARDVAFIPRALWGYRGSLGPGAVKLPVGTVFLHHTVTRVTSDPCADARAVAAVGTARFGRLSYSYLIHPSGVILEGMGERIGAHTAGYNSSSLALAFIGNLENTKPTNDAIASACWLLWVLRAFGGTKRTFDVVPHRAVSATACPGRHGLEVALPFLRAVAGDPNWKPAP